MDPSMAAASASHPPDDSSALPDSPSQNAALSQSQDQRQLEMRQSVQDEASALRELATTARDQDDLEKDIGRQADQMLLDQANERDQKRLDKTQSQRDKLVSQLHSLKRRLAQHPGPSAATRLRNEISHLQPQIDSLDRDLSQIQLRIDQRHQDDQNQDGDSQDKEGNHRLPGETRRDFLIRTGKITPFSRIGRDFGGDASNLADVMMDAEGGDSDEDEQLQDSADQDVPIKPMSHRNLLKPGFADDDAGQNKSLTPDFPLRPTKKRKTKGKKVPDENHTDEVGSSPAGSSSSDEYKPKDDITGTMSDQESESDDWGYVAEGNDHELSVASKKAKGKRRKARKHDEDEDEDDNIQDLAGVDDGDENVYSARLKKWVTGRKIARRKAQAQAYDISERTVEDEQTAQEEEEEEQEEWLMPHPTRSDTQLEGGFRIPGDVYPSLFDYQKTGVQWLWELYSQQVGGIIGDEMGLGKTIQIIAFLAGLHHSDQLNKPIIIVTPATVMKQWVNEFHQWWPPLRVSILHTSGSGMIDVRKERVMEDDLEYDRKGSVASRPTNKRAKQIVDRVIRQGHVLVTTYAGLQSYADLLLPVQWGYAVLDEGHKIRNPNAKITIFCKSLRTANRIILSGTPMQNNLTELWSLFDFVFPLRLGNLVNFRTQFEMPIKHGGYANASNLQVETALKCAETLKDAISPYLLQRFKVDVAADLPKKTEQVLFCRLTKTQRDAYESFLSSSEMDSILSGRRRALYGIDILRKICNHPDLVDHRNLSVKPGYNYGSGVKSGKMQVVKALLQLWKDTGHKTLLFAQHRIMLDILEKFVKSLQGFIYRRMDGETQIKDRQDMVDEFNRDPDIHVFLLTTKVGGLGVNLTGADRVIIYDPDWNPSTDMQARERAWRLGQQREVMIYRLMTAGTIEEKIYHRQIFKQFLTNKILRDPKQRQTFQLKDLHDLFTLGDANEETETANLFKNSEVKFDKVAAAAAASEPNDSSKINDIVGIAHREEYQTGEETTSSSTQTANHAANRADEMPNNAQTSPEKNKNDRLLSTIFARSDVQSAVEHDAIINGRASSSRNQVKADPQIIAREAKRVAAAAAEELRRAGETARHVPAGTPTWTGLHGSGGRPDDPPTALSNRGAFSGGRGRGRGVNANAGPSSASILANLSARQGVSQNQAVSAATNTDGENSNNNTASQQPRGREFLQLIRDYLLAHGGAVYTQMLIDHFNRFCTTPERTAEFKEMLRAIAVLDRGQSASGSASGSESPASRGRGGMGIIAMRRERERAGRGGRAKWVLKREFGGTA